MDIELNQLLENATGTMHNILVNRCNSAILMALKLAKKVNGGKVVLVQDQGGWLSYEKLAKKAGLEIRKIKTKDGVIVDYKQLFDEDVAAVLFTQIAGYCLKQEWNIKHLLEMNDSKALAIMDCSGCVGTPLCNGAFADLVVASFGKWKALDVGYGGVVGANNEKYHAILEEFKDERFEFDKNKLDDLKDGINDIVKRMNFLYDHCNKIVKDLKEYEVLWDKGIVVIVKYKNLDEKNKIIQYCDDNGYEFTECPREIRVMDNAISIEVKRLKE